MISYEVYKILHIGFILLFLSGIAIGFFGSSNTTGNKIVSGVASVLIFVAGMGMMARLNIGHGEPWPLWIKIKVVLWLLLAGGGPVLVKRVQKNRVVLFYSLLFLFILAAYAAIFKPGS